MRCQVPVRGVTARERLRALAAASPEIDLHTAHKAYYFADLRQAGAHSAAGLRGDPSGDDLWAGVAEIPEIAKGENGRPANWKSEDFPGGWMVFGVR